MIIDHQFDLKWPGPQTQGQNLEPERASNWTQNGPWMVRFGRCTCAVYMYSTVYTVQCMYCACTVHVHCTVQYTCTVHMCSVHYVCTVYTAVPCAVYCTCVVHSVHCTVTAFGWHRVFITVFVRRWVTDQAARCSVLGPFWVRNGSFWGQIGCTADSVSLFRIRNMSTVLPFSKRLYRRYIFRVQKVDVALAT